MFVVFTENHQRKVVNLNLCNSLTLYTYPEKELFYIGIYQNRADGKQRSYNISFANEEELNKAWDSLLNAIEHQEPCWIAPDFSNSAENSQANRHFPHIGSAGPSRRKD